MLLSTDLFACLFTQYECAMGLDESSQAEVQSLPGGQTDEVRGPAAGTAPRTAERDRCPRSESDRPLVGARRAVGAAGAWGERPPRVGKGIPGDLGWNGNGEIKASELITSCVKPRYGFVRTPSSERGDACLTAAFASAKPLGAQRGISEQGW